jgi:hypothetical protein
LMSILFSSPSTAAIRRFTRPLLIPEMGRRTRHHVS